MRRGGHGRTGWREPPGGGRGGIGNFSHEFSSPDEKHQRVNAKKGTPHSKAPCHAIRYDRSCPQRSLSSESRLALFDRFQPAGSSDTAEERHRHLCNLDALALDAS